MKRSSLSVLWWGRCERGYSRNRIIAGLFEMLGWRVEYFHPIISELGVFEAFLKRPSKPDLVWIPCFRQRDVKSAVFWARRWEVPVIFEPLTSAYEKDVHERKKWPEASPRAKARLRWEAGLFDSVDRVILETHAYARFVENKMGISKEKLGVIYQGANPEFFSPRPAPPPFPPFEVLFFGSFQPSMGTDVIVEAARMTKGLPIKWVLVGEGDLKPEAMKRAEGLENIFFEGWLPYEELGERLARAHILLGIFGTTYKTDFVIPNKVYESMATGRPLITRSATAYEESIGGCDAIGWVDGGDPASLAETVKRWTAEPDSLEKRGAETRRLFETHFGMERLAEMLDENLEKVIKASGPEKRKHASDDG